MRKDCRIVVLYSGSGGNSVFIKVGENAILIDAGKSARALCNALCSIGESIDGVDAIFITHEHSDHVSALEVLTKKRDIPVHITEISAQRFDGGCNTLLSRLVRHDVHFCQEVGEMRISSFRTPHDSRMSVGYRIEFPDGDGRYMLGLATDIGYVSEEIKENLRGCDAVIIESNHDRDMLMQGPYPRELKQRVASKRGHLSNCECAELVSELAESGTRAFILAHLSRENNEVDIALDEVRRAVSGTGAYVIAADPDRAVELTEEITAYDECEAYNPWNA